MNTIQIDPTWLAISGTALAIGILLGAFTAWLIGRSRERQINEQLRILESQVKDQDAIQAERDSAYEAATTRLATAFSELSNLSRRH